MRRVLSWLLRSKVLSNKEYKDMVESGEALTRDVAFWNKAYDDAHEILTHALKNDLIERPAELEDAQKKFEAALEGLRSEYHSIYQMWTQAMASDQSLKKRAEELRARTGQRPR